MNWNCRQSHPCPSFHPSSPHHPIITPFSNILPRFLTYCPSCAKTKVAFLSCLWEKNGEVRNYGELATLSVDFGWLVVVGVLMTWQFLPSQTPQYETRIVVLKAKANLAAVFGNRTAVKRLLMQTAEQSQRELIPQLEAWKQQGEVRRYRRFWIINAIAVEGTQQVFQALERHPAVAAIRPIRYIPAPRPIPSRRIVINKPSLGACRKSECLRLGRHFKFRAKVLLSASLILALIPITQTCGGNCDPLTDGLTP